MLDKNRYKQAIIRVVKLHNFLSWSLKLKISFLKCFCSARWCGCAVGWKDVLEILCK